MNHATQEGGEQESCHDVRVAWAPTEGAASSHRFGGDNSDNSATSGGGTPGSDGDVGRDDHRDAERENGHRDADDGHREAEEECHDAEERHREERHAEPEGQCAHATAIAAQLEELRGAIVTLRSESGSPAEAL